MSFLQNTFFQIFLEKNFYCFFNYTVTFFVKKMRDCLLQAERVSAKHALIEYHPQTRSFWLRDLHSGSDGGILGNTSRNGQQVYGMIELKNGDILRFGESQDYMFHMPKIGNGVMVSE